MNEEVVLPAGEHLNNYKYDIYHCAVFLQYMLPAR